MKRIGLLGGMSWESSLVYYRLINQATHERLGGLHSADCVLRSVEFGQIEELMRGGDWQAVGELLAAEARLLEAAGSELLVLCTNTMHRVAEEIDSAVGIPLVHIADPTAEAVKAAGVTSVGLIATAYTMEQDFYVGRLRQLHGLEVIVPDEEDRHLVHDVIFNELCVGVINDLSRQAYLAVITRLVDQGARAIILGCTEIGLLISPDDVEVPVFDTAALHARRASSSLCIRSAFALGSPSNAAAPAGLRRGRLSRRRPRPKPLLRERG
jgi:aspartate racemase